jgi:hypothetical protein
MVGGGGEACGNPIQVNGPLEGTWTICYDEDNMTHEYDGHYRTKHELNAQLDSNVTDRIWKKVDNGRLSCASAFVIAQEAGTSPAEVGRHADLLETKITACQLGLFGHVKERRNIVEPAEKVSNELEEALRGGIVDGRLPCREAWEIAERFGLSKMRITAACERLKIRFSECQLGTF